MKSIVAALVLLALLPAHTIRGVAHAALKSYLPAMGHGYAGIPLSFEVNRGQTSSRVRFLVRGAGYTMFLTPNEAILSVAQRTPAVFHGSRIDTRKSHSLQGVKPIPTNVLRLRFRHANPHVKLIGLDRMSGIVNYFLGRNPGLWHTDIPTFSRVEYQNMYPGIDLVFYSKQHQLEYDWILHPHARASNIQLSVFGTHSLYLDTRGNLTAAGGGATLIQRAPIAYQSGRISNHSIAVGYTLGPNGHLALRLGSYDHRKTLVIDPVLSFATYVGGQQSDSGFSIAVDGAGEPVVSGSTISPDFPTKNPVQQFRGNGKGDAFVGKFSASGTSLIYMTYLGGSDYDQGYSVTVDHSGNAYVGGETISRDFPLMHAFQSTFGGGSDDGFVAELNTSGDTLLFSSYVGGNDEDALYAIAVSSDGSIGVAGNTKSGNFPLVHPYQAKLAGTQGPLRTLAGGPGGNEPPPESTGSDAFVMKINPDRTLVFSTFLGGKEVDAAAGIAIDSHGNVIVSGQTRSSDFPSTANALQPKFTGSSDGFVTKFDPSGQTLLYSTFLGGNDQIGVAAMAIDSADSVYLTGQASSTDFEIKNAAQPKYAGGDGSFFYGDAFVTKLDSTGSVVYSTYLGGSHDDEGRAIAVDNAGDAYVTGDTDSADFPMKDAIQPAFTGGRCGAGFCQEAFIAKFDASGQLSFSTYFGGSRKTIGSGIAADSAGAAYIFGTTESTDMPTAQPIRAANTSTQEAAADAFLAKLASGTTQIDHSLVIDRLQMLHKVKGHMQRTTSLHAGETAKFVAMYHDKSQAAHLASGSLVISRGGKEIMQLPLDGGGTKSKPSVTTVLTFKGARQLGALVASVSLVRGLSTSTKSLRFTVKAR